MTTVMVPDGLKYAIVRGEGDDLKVELCDKGPWRSLSGDGLVLAMAQEIEALREALKASEDRNSALSAGFCDGVVGDDYGRTYCRHKRELESGTLTAMVTKAVAEAGGVRAAAKKFGLDPAYLSRLCAGEKSNPSAQTLSKLGIRAVISYRRLK